MKINNKDEEKTTNSTNTRKSVNARRSGVPPNIPLETDETLIHIEDATSLKLSPEGTVLTLFLFLGFPLYGFALLGFVGGLIGGVPLEDLLRIVYEPAMGLIILLVILLAVTPFVSKHIQQFCPKKTALVITNRRVFLFSSDFNTGAGLSETPSTIMESRFEETLAISTKQYGKSGYVNFQLKRKEKDEDGSQKDLHVYPVSDAEKFYSRLPLEVRQKAGPKSKAGIIESKKDKRNQITATIAAVLILAFLSAVGTSIVLQETGENHMRKGRDAYRAHDYIKSEKHCKLAYDNFSKMPFHSDYGPACYRLALAYKANGKLDLAIPLFKEATKRCDWQSHESHVTWKPAVFRSFTYLGEIYADRGDAASAEEYFEAARQTMLKETKSKYVTRMVKSYSTFLRSQGNETQAQQIETAGTLFVPVKSHIKAFRQ